MLTPDPHKASCKKAWGRIWPGSHQCPRQSQAAAPLASASPQRPRSVSCRHGVVGGLITVSELPHLNEISLKPSPVRLGWYGDVRRSHAGSTRLCHLACPGLCPTHKGVAICPGHSGMSATTRLSEARLELALPSAPRPVHEWVGTPANSLNAPPHTALWSGMPQVLYAEYKPRLSGPELPARYRGAVVTVAADEPSRGEADRPSARSALRDRADRLRRSWWSALVVAAVAFSAGTPVF